MSVGDWWIVWFVTLAALLAAVWYSA